MDKGMIGLSKFFANLTIPLTILLCSIVFLRIFIQKVGMISFLAPVNRLLHKVHIPLGILLIMVSILHGFFSPVSLWTPSWGSAGILVLFALGGTYLLKSIFKGMWLNLHRILAVIFIICVVLHLMIEVPIWKKAIRNQPLSLQSERIQIKVIAQ